VPFAAYRLDHHAGVELAAIDAHRATETAADLEVDSIMVLRARRGGTGSKYVTFRGGLRRAIPFLLVGSGAGEESTTKTDAAETSLFFSILLGFPAWPPEAAPFRSRWPNRRPKPPLLAHNVLLRCAAGCGPPAAL
jgi:hypothetical protein